MLLVDQNKAILVGKLNIVVKELAFLVDKLSEQGDEKGDASPEQILNMFHEEVAGFQKDRERGISREHPHDEGDSSGGRDSSDKKERATAAEAALIEAMKEIQEMRAEKAQKAEKAEKKKRKKSKKKDL